MSKKIMTIMLLLAMVSCAVLAPVTTGIADGDWNNASGTTSSPWVSDVETPILDDEKDAHVRAIWSDNGIINGMSEWQVTGTPVTVGDYAYYAKYNGGDTYTLKKVQISTGESIRTAKFDSQSFFCNHLSYGDGKLFVLVRAGAEITFDVFSADDLSYLYSSQQVAYGGDIAGTQGYMTFVEHGGSRYVMFGTYSGPFVCFNADDGSRVWINGNGGFYNQTPVIIGDYCVFADSGYSERSASGGTGSTIYVCRISDGSVAGTYPIADGYHILSGLAFDNGRLYWACETHSVPGSDPTDLRVYSCGLTVGSTAIFADDLEMWNYGGKGTGTSCGTQASIVIVNDRLYLNGGGYTTGTQTYLSVIDINGSSMETAYYIPVDGKGTVTVSTAYPGVSYLYFTGYDGSCYFARDEAGQTEPFFTSIPIGTKGQNSFQAVTISSDGYLLVKSDKDLVCVGLQKEWNGGYLVVGDVNDDGVFSAKDVTRMARSMARLTTIEDSSIRADVNGDGVFSGKDVTMAARNMANLNKRMCYTVR